MNQGQELDQKRLLLAVVLSAVVLMLWQATVPVPPPVQKAPAAAGDAGIAKANPAPGAEAATPSTATPGTPAGQPDAQVIEARTLTTLKQPGLHTLDLSNEDGQIGGWVLEETQYQAVAEDGLRSPFPFVRAVDGSANVGVFLPPLLQLHLGGALTRGDYRLTAPTDSTARLQWTDPKSGVQVTRAYTLDADSYTTTVELILENPSAGTVPFDLSALFRGVQNDEQAQGSMFMPPVYLYESVCKRGDDFERFNADAIVDSKTDGDPVAFSDGIRWGGVDNRYFMAALVADPGSIERCTANATRKGVPPGFTLVSNQLDLAGGEIPPGGQVTRKIKFYAGPKKLSELQKFPEPLNDAIDFGIFSIICVPMLWLMRVFYGFAANWGLAIILLTIVVKLITLPLTIKQYRSMAAMKKIQPQMKKVQEKYKEDKVKLQQEMMKLYRENQVNPLAGCLPMLMMMPIYFSLYRTIYSAVELYQAEFFGWITDLSIEDPIYVTPVLLGALMFVQMRLNPSAGDQMQQKILMNVMPIMFTAMMLFLPSGLVLYILVNTFLGIFQQLWILKKTNLKPLGAKA